MQKFQNGVFRAKCGRVYKVLKGFDVNSLYAFVLSKDQPCGPGILFKPQNENSNIYTGQCMLNKSDGWGRMSFVSIEWLEHVSKQPEFLKSTNPNTYYPMQTYLSGGEKKFIHEGKLFALDGFIQTDLATYAFSFKGCHFHFCPQCGKNLNKKDEEIERDR